MAQIFVSHSSKDRSAVSLFSEAAASTKVRLVFEEFEKFFTGEITATKIQGHIHESKAVFIILSEHVEMLSHTRDWVGWESGVASSGVPKDIWIFEPWRQLGRIGVAIPRLRHYVLFDINDSYRTYIRRIIESYDASHVLPTLLLTAGVGALIGRGEGAIAGAAAGLMLSDRSASRPSGVQVICAKCQSSFHVHLPQTIHDFRCPVCSTALRLTIGSQ